MPTVWIYTLVSTILVSFIALIGILLISLAEKHFKKIIMLLVSFSAGALIGDAFIHILPEITEEFGFDLLVSFSVLGGMLVFYILENFIHWHHCHHAEHGHHSKNDQNNIAEHARSKPFIVTNLVGDGLHNFVDGVFIASSYLVDVRLGIATTIAVILHEIPQELGDFGVLVHGGIHKKRAIFLNFASGFFAIAGAVFGLIFGQADKEFLHFILPFTAGGYIYVANADLFPELHKNSGKGYLSILHFFLILLGIATMALLLLVQ